MFAVAHCSLIVAVRWLLMHLRYECVFVSNLNVADCCCPFCRGWVCNGISCW